MHEACRATGRELLIEIIAGKHGVLAEDTVAAVIERLYQLGIKPDWWKLEPQASEAAWTRIERGHRGGRPVLPRRGDARPRRPGGGASARPSRQRRGVGIVKGFAIGRTIFADAAERWLAGRLSDEGAVAEMSARFRRLCEAWDRRRCRRPRR